jgi:hypothetical protein
VVKGGGGGATAGAGASAAVGAGGTGVPGRASAGAVAAGASGTSRGLHAVNAAAESAATAATATNQRAPTRGGRNERAIEDMAGSCAPECSARSRRGSHAPLPSAVGRARNTMSDATDLPSLRHEALRRCPPCAVGELLPAIAAAADGGSRAVATESRTPRDAEESEMATDEQWVEDVKRWVLAAHQPVGDPIDDIAIGVEAAQPALQALYWPDAPTTDR